MNIIFKIYLTIIALLPALVIFLIKNDIFLLHLLHLKSVWLYLLYFFILLIVNYVAVFWAKGLGKNNIPKGDIMSIEQVNDSFLPSYLGYFFVSLSIPSVEIFIFIFLLIGILVFFSRSAYFNPMFLLFGFNFYNCTTKIGVKILIITKQQIKLPRSIGFTNIRRINNFTFIDIKELKNG